MGIDFGLFTDHITLASGIYLQRSIVYEGQSQASSVDIVLTLEHDRVCVLDFRVSSDPYVCTL